MEASYLKAHREGIIKREGGTSFSGAEGLYLMPQELPCRQVIR